MIVVRALTNPSGDPREELVGHRVCTASLPLGMGRMGHYSSLKKGDRVLIDGAGGGVGFLGLHAAFRHGQFCRAGRNTLFTSSTTNDRVCEARMQQPSYLLIDHPWVRHELVPIYEWAFPDHPSDEELQSFISARNRWARHAKYPVAWLVDLSNMTTASATQRKVFAEHVKSFEPYDIKYTVGVAAIVPNRLMRGLVTAVYWLTPPQFPNRIFADRTSGIHWLKQQLAE